MSGHLRLTGHRRSSSPISAYSDNFELMQPRPPSIGARIRNVTRYGGDGDEIIAPPPPSNEILPGRRDFKDYEERMRNMPQHNPDLPPPAGRNGRYVRFSKSGLWTWVAGIIFFRRCGVWPGGDPTPRAVSEEWYDTICPKGDRVVLDTEKVAGHLKESDAQTLIDFWAQKLKDMDDKCVEIDGREQVFNFYLTGSTRVLSAFDEFSKSATMQMLKWSDLVVGAVKRNFALISPVKQRNSRPLIFYPEGKIEGLLAMHVRRGDYSYHCTHFANWSSTYTSWALLPQLPDAFKIPEGAGGGQATPEAVAEYHRVCWPTNAQIVERARLMRKLHPGLDRIYILTNGKPDYLAKLKEDLRADGWKKLSTSQDMTLNWQEMWVSQSIDMSIAQRAEVFIGNGFSTLSSNVAMLRLSRGLPFNSVRFW
ncbi:GDP-fucose protein O-fucosyltransferase [Rhizoctonia solani]|uniref:GDP-fucose protein O-fucosyltransferase n=1 Tax=Rhizoctonia solani TaxID=456999 RepID=A0A8H7I786_9AGAM|nr:GDP-fucose protein O-fucosyltransferase [Rhizoctonia solani]